MKTFPALRQLLLGYLNLDWPEEYRDPWKAIEDFFRSESEYRHSIPGEVADLIDIAPSEIKLRRYVLNELGSGYLPEADGWTYRDWLEEISRRAVESVESVQSPLSPGDPEPKKDE